MFFKSLLTVTRKATYGRLGCFYPPTPPPPWTYTQDVNEKQMCRRGWGWWWGHYVSTKTWGLEEPENPKLGPFLDWFLCMRRHPWKSTRGKIIIKKRTGWLTDIRTDMYVCVCIRERSVFVCNPPWERTARLPRGLSWSDPVACMETLNSVTSFVQCIVQHHHHHNYTHTNTHTLPPPLTWIWLAAACGIRPHRLPGSAGCWMF